MVHTGKMLLTNVIFTERGQLAKAGVWNESRIWQAFEAFLFLLTVHISTLALLLRLVCQYSNNGNISYCIETACQHRK